MKKNAFMKNLWIYSLILLVVTAIIISLFVCVRRKYVNDDLKDAQNQVEQVEARIFHKEKFPYNKTISDKYENIIKILKSEDNAKLYTLRDVLQILLVIELKKDQGIKNNIDKINLINALGRILTTTKKESLVGEIKKILDDNKVDSAKELKENILHFINKDNLKDESGLEDIKRNHSAKKITENNIVKVKRSECFIEIPSVNLKIKKILILDENNERIFSESKYINLFYSKRVSAIGSNYKNELYISEMIKIIFPEYYYKIREYHDGLYDQFVVIKLKENAKDIPADDIENLNINKQSIFDSIALALLFNLNDRCNRNYMILKDNFYGENFMFNIDFESFLDKKITADQNHFKIFFQKIKNVQSNKKEILKLLIKHVNSLNHSMDDASTTTLYNKLFENVRQEEINQYAKSFLDRFSKKNMEEIKKVNSEYKKALESKTDGFHCREENRILSQNIELISSVIAKGRSL
jgi:hypothetical protein